eukprot:TRINITY_DN6028_c0_g1_i4.p1 TRINITY_DN6028_c0_g1~~TRINITY_DN6028_c0_g1_i4.p1  ORF type:complete len:196 (-),score=21.25 TRINITY_DN6028_c0_g1_i4:832-1389(-)
MMSASRLAGTKLPWGPRISMVLPSFSGRTLKQPQLLWYGCQLQAKVNVATPILVQAMTSLPLSSFKNRPALANSVPSSSQAEGTDEKSYVSNYCYGSDEDRTLGATARRDAQVLQVLTSRPILSLVFSDMRMAVAAPTPVTVEQKKEKAIEIEKERGRARRQKGREGNGTEGTWLSGRVPAATSP